MEMNTISEFYSRIKFIKITDVIQIIPAILGYIASLFIRIRHNNVWLVCERKSDARDNGYWFFKFLREAHPEIVAIYAIDKQSPDYKKVKDLGRVIQFGSLTHWMYYWAADKNISSHNN